MSKKHVDNVKELLAVLAEASMHATIEVSWEDTEEELMKRFISLIATPDDEDNPGSFAVMQAVGLTGTVLALKYEKNEDELMKLLKDSKVKFVKEIMND